MMTRETFVGMMDDRLKLVRTEYGLTQEKMSQALGISKKTLVEIEKGRRSLGWTGAVACAEIFGDSTILQNDFGGEMTDLISSLAFQDLKPQYPHTLGGRIWWEEVEARDGFHIQQNIISGHYRLLDSENRRIGSSFDLEMVEARLDRVQASRK